MKWNYLGTIWGKTSVFVSVIFLIIILGFITLHASEKEVRHANQNTFANNQLFGPNQLLPGDNRLQDIFSPGDLPEKNRQLNQTPKAKKTGSGSQFFPILNSERLAINKRQNHLLKISEKKQVLKNRMKGQSKIHKTGEPASETDIYAASSECPPEVPIDCGDGTCCFEDFPGCCGDGYCYQNPEDCTFDPNGGCIYGRVIIDPSGAPIEGIGIDVYDMDWNWYGIRYTDENGDYRVCGLPTGDYYVKPWDQCYIDEYYDNVLNQSDATLVYVEAPNDTPNINFALELGGSISGRVIIDPSGAPIEGIGINVYDMDSNWYGSEYTDSVGYYSTCGLPTGDYYVGTWNNQDYIDEWYQDAVPFPWESDPPPVHVNAPNETPNIDLMLKEGGVISGTLKDTSSVGIGNITVKVYHSSGNWSGYAWSDMEGHYTVNGVPTGDHYVVTENDQGYLDEWYDNVLNQADATLVHVEAPNDKTNIDFVLEMGGSISGRVTVDPTGEGIEAVGVHVYDVSGYLIGKYDGSDSEGHYIVNGLPTGYYNVHTSNIQGYVDESYDNVLNQPEATLVHVEAPNNTLDIDFALALGGTITGTITECNTDPPLPIEDVEVYAEDVDTGYRFYADDGSDSEGLYIVNKLPAANYRICVDNNTANYLNTCHDSPVEVVAGNEYIQDLCLEVGGKITGTITVDPTGEPLEGVEVRLYDSEDNWLRGYSSFSNSVGYYEVNGLPTGSYYIQTDNNEGYIDEWYNNALCSSDASLVSVEAANETSDINFSLALGGIITGTVGVCDDQLSIIEPKEDIHVSTSNCDQVECDSGDSTSSDEDGGYVLQGLPTGNYQVCAYSCGVYSLATCTESCVEVIVGSEPKNLDICLEPCPSISGTITCDDCSGGSPIFVLALSEELEPDFSNLMNKIIGISYIYQLVESNPYEMKLAYNDQMWIYAWWMSESHDPILLLGDYFGSYDANPINAPEGNPTGIDIQLKKVCDSNDDCDDGNPCTDDSCNAGSTCENTNNTASCNDGQYCNGTDTCNGGSCASSGTPCPSGTSCNENNDSCIIIDSCPSNCDDGRFCNGDESCVGGRCRSEGNPCPSGTSCDENNDSCIPIEDECTSDADCDDELYCNGDETCVNGNCQSSGNPCPDDGLFCNGNESCSEATDACVSSGTPCGDGEFCNGVETCEEATDTCVSPGDPCSDPTPVCDEGEDACVPPPPPCTYSIEPETTEVLSGETLAFTVTVTGDGCNYQLLVESSIGSSCDQSGNYTAGTNNDFFNNATDLVRVVDQETSSETTASVTVLWKCPLVQIYGGDSEEVKALRSFRDNVLSQTSEGQEIVSLYYELSPVIAKAIEQDDEFKKQVKGMIDGVLGLIGGG